MRKLMIPPRAELEGYAVKNSRVRPAEILAMLRVLQAAECVKEEIFDELEADYRLSRGRFAVMAILSQNGGRMSPSKLADMAGVSRATVSMMLVRLARDGLACEEVSETDARQKYILLTEKGMTLMEAALTAHYCRVSALMERLTEAEQETLIGLLEKLEG